jgi:hypothetical protein
MSRIRSWFVVPAVPSFWMEIAALVQISFIAARKRPRVVTYHCQQSARKLI